MTAKTEIEARKALQNLTFKDLGTYIDCSFKLTEKSLGGDRSPL